jgi:hypothetical protein
MSRKMTFAFIAIWAAFGLQATRAGALTGHDGLTIDSSGKVAPLPSQSSLGNSAPGIRSYPIAGTTPVDPTESPLERRIAMLEGSVQDSSAIATVFVFVVGLLVAANAGLSVWQVGSLAQKEVDAAIGRYDDQFHGFLSQRKDLIAERLTRYGDSVSSVSRQVHDVSQIVQGHEDFVSETITSIDKLTREAVFKIQEEGRRQRENLVKARARSKRQSGGDKKL